MVRAKKRPAGKIKKVKLSAFDIFRLTFMFCFGIIVLQIRNFERFIKMKETKIKLSNVQDIREFVNVVILADYDVDLVQGRYVIDAKSIMGIFSLDLLSPITLIAHSDKADALFEKMAKFIV